MGELEEIIDSIFFGQHDDVGTESESLVMNRPFRRPLKRDLSTIESITEEDEEEEEFDNDSQEIFEEEIYKLDDGSIRRKTISPHRSVTHRQGEELTDEESNFEEETDSVFEGSVEMETAAAGDSRRTFGAGFAGISTVPTFEGRVATLDKKEDEQYEPDIFGRRNAKNRRNWFTNQYGANYMVMSGWELRRDLGPTPTASSDVIPYLKQLYVDENMDISELKQGPGNAPHAQRVGEPLKLPSCDLTEWRILSPPTFLEEMTTQGIQKTICAALNSRRRLRWLIGVNPMGVAVGCRLTLEQRDILSQAIDWCGAKEFVPVLVPRTIRIRFIPLLEEGEDLFEDNVTEGCLYVVELRVDEIADQLYQLSSGRVFFVRNERCAQAVSMDEVRQGLEKERAWKKDKEETAPFRFDPLHPNPLYGALTVAGFMALLVVYRKWY